MPREDCVDDSRTEKLTLRLNASALSDPPSLVLDPFSEPSPKTIQKNVTTPTLLSVSSTPIAPIPPLSSLTPTLRSDCNSPTVPLTRLSLALRSFRSPFASGEVLSVDFYPTPLDNLSLLF